MNDTLTELSILKSAALQAQNKRLRQRVKELETERDIALKDIQLIAESVRSLKDGLEDNAKI